MTVSLPLVFVLGVIAWAAIKFLGVRPYVGIGAGAVAVVVVVGIVLTALLAAVAVSAVSVAIAAVVLRSLVSSANKR
ncbi:hypothetical protein ABZ400_33245 [Streptomyces sp. NPDC005897]|uniref:hypothetical protein n=1 Tax=Streptomyces sp. NPDC005897 TaxID=3157081 RepID=UPI0033F69A5E